MSATPSVSSMPKKGLTEGVKAAVNRELDLHRNELEEHADDTSQINLTVKVDRRRVRKVLYSRTTERDIKEA